MSCPSAEILVRFALEDELPDQNEVRQHVVHCQACRLAVETIRSQEGALASALSAVGEEQPEGPCVDAVQLAAYLDRRLTTEENLRVEEHLSRCASCREELISAQGRLSAFEAGWKPLPNALAESARVCARGGGFRDRVGGWLAARSRRWAMVTAAVAALVIAAFSVWRIMPSPSGDSSRAGATPSSDAGGPPFVRQQVADRSAVLMSGLLRPTPAIWRALQDYAQQETPARRTALLSALRSGELKIEDEKVVRVEISTALRARLTRPRDEREVEARLYRSGVLELTVQP